MGMDGVSLKNIKKGFFIIWENIIHLDKKCFQEKYEQM